MHNSKCISGNSSRATEARKRLKWSFQKPKPIATFSCLALGWWMDFWKCSWWWALCASFMGWKLDCNILKHQKYTLQKTSKGILKQNSPTLFDPATSEDLTEEELISCDLDKVLASFAWIRCSFTHFKSPTHYHLHALRFLARNGWN